MANEPADPIARGVVASAKQNLHDLFIWKQRVVVRNEDGETTTEWQNPDAIENPFGLLAQLGALDWAYFMVGFLAWTADAFDFHALSIQTVKLADHFETSKTNISTAITLTLLLRSVGAAIFGLAGDRWGRKWPMVCNMIILGLLQVGTLFCDTLYQFFAVRALFGLFMGGVYGNAVAMALENCPANARGLMSGILQQGYSFGYVVAASANLAIGGDASTWKTLFWVGAGLSIGVGLIRILFPESKLFLEAKASGNLHHESAGAFWASLRKMLKQEWKMSVYCIVLMTWFNYFSHTSQDSYTTFMRVGKELDNADASRASILMKTGACIGGTILGYLSQHFGRRRVIVFAAIMAGCMIPAWILPNSVAGLSCGGFAIQFFIQGAWGVVPIHLNELSPPAFRASFPGITYQLGNMISAPASQIVNAVAEQIHVTTPKTGDRVEAYGPVMAVATAIIVVLITTTTVLGPERRGRSFVVETDDDEIMDGKRYQDEEKGEVEVQNVEEKKAPA